MHSRFITLLAVGCLVLAEAPVEAQPGGHGGENGDAARHGWRFDLDAGKAEARKSGKPLMVVLRCVP